MGQKTNPVGFRLGVNKTWESRWIARKSKFADYLNYDLKVKQYINTRLATAMISKVEVERYVNNIVLTIYTARPGQVIGRKGAEIDKLREEVRQLINEGVKKAEDRIDVDIDVKEIKRPELDAQLIAKDIARQLEQRVSFRRAMKRAISQSMKAGVLGIKIRTAGRLDGAEMARIEGYKDGRIPLHTLRADIDYATFTAKTIYGIIGVKVWLYKGEILETKVGK